VCGGSAGHRRGGGERVRESGCTGSPRREWGGWTGTRAGALCEPGESGILFKSHGLTRWERPGVVDPCRWLAPVVAVWMSAVAARLAGVLYGKPADAD
jgi:hypothetical protein